MPRGRFVNRPYKAQEPYKSDLLACLFDSNCNMSSRATFGCSYHGVLPVAMNSMIKLEIQTQAKPHQFLIFLFFIATIQIPIAEASAITV